MSKALNITIVARLDEPELLENLVEKLAYRPFSFDHSREKMPHNQQTIDTSTTETYISGTLAIECEDEIINMPFITCFLFTCLKEDERCKLTWAASLS